MPFKTVVIITSLVVFISLNIGLIIRIIREGCGTANIYKTYLLAIKFLIIYPIFFPFLLYKNREFFIEKIVEFVFKNGNYEQKNITKKKVKKIVKNQFTLIYVLKTWIKLIRSINQNHNKYVYKNVILARDYINKVNKKKEIVNIKKRYGVSRYRLYLDNILYNVYSGIINVKVLQIK